MASNKLSFRIVNPFNFIYLTVVSFIQNIIFLNVAQNDSYLAKTSLVQIQKYLTPLSGLIYLSCYLPFWIGPLNWMLQKSVWLVASYPIFALRALSASNWCCDVMTIALPTTI